MLMKEENTQQNNENKVESLDTKSSSSEPILKSNNRVKKSKKPLIISLAIVLLLALGAVGYVIGVYIPNKPENVFKKGLENFANKKDGYHITGKIDQGDNNAPDFNFNADVDKNSNSSSELTISDFIISPTISYRNINGQSFVNLNNVLNSVDLAKKYTNIGKPGLAEEIAKLADLAKLKDAQDKWVEVPFYLLQSGESPSNINPETVNTDIYNITPKIDGTENVNGVQARKYEITLTRDNFLSLVTLFGSGNVANPLSESLISYSQANQMSNSLPFSIWINPKTKRIVQISYSGRPYKDATLDFKVTAANKTIEVSKSYDLFGLVDYGIVDDHLFNKSTQNATTDGDKERFADLKGIKTALEIYKNKNGYYPSRGNIAVGQEAYVSKNMPGASLNVFKDPNGRFIGKNGSQYAYVPAAKDGNENCSGKDCTKYFIVTTLDNGQKLQYNSEN